MRTAIAVLAGLCVVGCVQGTAVDSPVTPSGSSSHTNTVGAISLNPASVSGKPGQTVAVVATVTNANGQPDSNVTVRWASSNASVATVSDSGMVTLVATGSTQITATAGKVTATATATVTNSPAPVATVRVSPSSVSLTPKQFTPLSVTTLDAQGTVLTGRAVTWSSSNTSIATVSTSGIVTAVAVGAAIITATSEGVSGTAHVTVAAASPAAVASVTVSPSTTSLTVGGTAQLTATDKDTSGTVLAGRAVTWTSNNTGVATVNANGQITAVAAGSATITASSGGQSGTASVSVTDAAVASVTLTPGTASLTPGQTVQLSATAKDASGNTLTGRSVTWSSTPSSVTTVSATGLVTAVATGSATITATIGGKSGTATVSVGQPGVASVAVTPTSASIGVGQNTQLTPRALSASGTTLTGVTYGWSSANTGTATVSSTGFVTGVAAGSTTITVSAGGKTATASIAVTASSGSGSVASVAVSPSSASLTVGQTQQLSSTDKNSSGGTTTGTTPTWSSSNTGVATVSSSGMVTAKAAGSATITATSSSKSGSASITVSGGTSTGSGSYANQPSGATVISERRFDNVTEGGWGTAFGGSNMSIIQDGSAPKSPSNVMQVTYPVGLPGGNSPMAQSIGTNGSYTQFYGSVWLKYSSNFIVDNAGINKIFYVWANDGVPTLCLCTSSPNPTGDFTPQIRTQDASELDLGPNVAGQTNYSFPRNRWVRLEVLLQMNTPGSSNGIAKIWADGVLIASYNNVPFVNRGTQSTWALFQLAPYWGGSGGTVSTPQFVWFDHLYGSGH